METKELKIQIPEGYCVDESKSTFEKIVFKKKDTKPRSWEEYCNNYVGKVFYIGGNSDICGGNEIWDSLRSKKDKNTLPSKELAEAFLAMMQLMSLRQAWIGEWEPDWKDITSKWSIVYEECRLGVCYFYSISHPLTFPTKEMADDFMNCFKDLLEVAKPLI